MNEYDSNRIIDLLSFANYSKVSKPDDAQCFIFNTCNIREKANQKVYSDVGKIRKKFRDRKVKPIIVLAGCVAQAESNLVFEKSNYVDIVVGPQSYHTLPDLLKNFQSQNKKSINNEFNVIEKFDKLNQIKRNSNKVSNYITIQEGCDKFCNFCVVPYTRGPEYSRPFSKILKEAEVLVKNGAREITLLGQNVNAYLYEDSKKKYRLSNLINELEKFSELHRIRYTTSHPKDMTDDLIECYSTNKKLMPFVHLPIQSGSNKILKLMNRKHTVEKYIEIYEKLIKINPKIEFSSDFIIAYPGETENDFNETLNLVKKIRFINSFSFIFSPRPGTVASNLDQIDNKIAKERLLKIQEYLFKFQLKKNESFINKSVDVLVENEIVGQNKLFGRNQYMNSVIFEGKMDDIGKVLKVKILKSNQNSLFGKKDINSNMRAA